MIATGKKARRETGLNRHELHRVKHSPKSEKKIRKMRWTRMRKV